MTCVVCRRLISIQRIRIGNLACGGNDQRVIHEHLSAPFDMASGKALFDLQS